MIVEAQLRALAVTASAEQRPVTVEEAISRAVGGDPVEEPPRRRDWMLVAATIALLVGGVVVLLVWDRTPEDDPLPGVSIPETDATEPVVPDTTVPATSLPDVETPTSVPTTLARPGGVFSEALVNEPTLDYRDGVEWWVPGGLPDGWRYGYAVDDGEVQTIRLLADDRSTIDVEFGADGATIGEVAVDSVTEELGGESWEVADSDGDSVAARVVDGRLLAVRGPIEPVRSLAGALELVPETELVRPPFRADAEPGPVVLTLPSDEVSGDEPFELRAHTDGLFTTVGGEIKQVSPEDPLAFGSYVYELTGDVDSYPVVVTGLALDGVEEITFGLLDGDAVTVTTTDSDRFAESFYAFVIDVPASVLEQYEQGGLERLTRWTFTFVDGAQRVYDEPASENCVNCDQLTVGPDEIDVRGDPPGGTSEDASPLVFEPTNVAGDELWLVPAEVPDGLEFAYAMRQAPRDQVIQQVVYLAADPGLGKSLWVDSHIRPAGSSAPTVPPGTAEVEIGGQTWSWEGDATHGILSAVIDGRLVEVLSDRTTAVAVAGALELVPGSQLPRPPFREDPSTSVVVATLSGAPTTADVPTELRAATDGVSIRLDAGTPRPLTSDEPVVFGGGLSPPPEPGADTGVFVISGMTVPEVATLEFKQLDGEVVTVVPEDVSGHFGIGFFLVALEVPADWMDTYASVVPSVVARDAGGDVLAAISEPF